MPTYEYECLHCGHHFERFQNITEEPLRHCPKCRHKVKRLLGTGAGIIFKGSGFYETDYKRKSSGSREKADDKPACPKATEKGPKPESDNKK